MPSEVFNSLMLVFLLLIIVNLIVLTALYRGTRSKEFGLLVLHWFFLGISFMFQKLMAGKNPLVHSVVIMLPNFGVHFTLVLAFGNLINYEMPWRRFVLIPVINTIAITILYFLKVEPVLFTMPLIVTHSFLYFYCAYKAFKYKAAELNFSLKFLTIIFVVYGIHLYDYAYFYNRLNLLAIGFAIAFGFEMAISILFPASIIEKMSRENERLKVDIDVQSKLTYSAKMVALGEMAGGVAHELNNPLTIISIMLEKAKGHAQTNKELLEILSKCSSTVDRMARIIKGLLTFSR